MISSLKDEKKRTLIFGIIIFSFTLLIYLPSLYIPFVSDEFSFIWRNQIHSFGSTFHLFNFQIYDSPYYRPLPDFISGIFTLLFGYNVVFYRIFNLTLHGLNGVILFYLVSAILREHPKGQLIALFSALFFCAFPLHDYAVIWNTDLFDRVMTIFYLLGLLTFIKNGFRPGIYSMLFFVFAILSKEMALSFPLIIWLTSYFLKEPRFKIKKSIIDSLPYAVVAILLILMRIILFNNNLFNTHGVHSHANLLDVIKDYTYFLGMLVFPFLLREMQAFLSLHKILFFSGGALIFCGMIYFLFKYRKKDYLLFFFILFIILTIAPASRLLMRWYLYLPSVGFTSLLAYFIVSFNSKRTKTAVTVLMVILVIYTGGLLRRENMWVQNSRKAIHSLSSFIVKYHDEIAKNQEVRFLTIPGKVDDIPVFQLGFDKLFNYYFGGNNKIMVKVDIKSYLSNFNDSIIIRQQNNYIELSQTNDNYFILFNDEKNVKFEHQNYKNGKLISLSIKKPEVKDKILITFSNGKFYKL